MWWWLSWCPLHAVRSAWYCNGFPALSIPGWLRGSSAFYLFIPFGFDFRDAFREGDGGLTDPTPRLWISEALAWGTCPARAAFYLFFFVYAIILIFPILVIKYGKFAWLCSGWNYFFDNLCAFLLSTLYSPSIVISPLLPCRESTVITSTIQSPS